MMSIESRLASPIALLLVSGCVAGSAPVQGPHPAIGVGYTAGGPPIPASGKCPAPTSRWRIEVHRAPGIDDRPLFSVIGQISLQDRQWAELREEYPDRPQAAPIYLVRLNVRMSPTLIPAGARQIELRNTQPVSSERGVVLVRCGDDVVARFEGVTWRG